MSKSLNIIWQYVRAFVLIYACLYAGIFLASLLPITIPKQHYRDVNSVCIAGAANSAGKVG